MQELSNAYALLIGVGADLPITAADAQSLYDLLSDPKIGGYPADNIELLTEEKADRQHILQAFDRLIEKVDEESSVLLFYSGHGGYYPPWQQFYLVPHGFDAEGYEDTWVKAEELQEKIKQLSSKRLVFFLDCCHAAGIGQHFKKSKSSTVSAEGLAQQLDDGGGMSIISSCRENESSWILDGDDHSLYTLCLQEVLRAEHKTYFNEPFIRISEVIQYLFRKVPERNPYQRPYANLQIYDDFIVSQLPAQKQVYLEKTIPVIENEKEAPVTVFREEEGAQGVILFVHGFSGEASDSFGQIPHLLMEEAELMNWDLFPVGFSSFIEPEQGKEIWASTADIERIADYLATSLRYRYAKYSQIALLGYSLGGLVVQKTITQLEEPEIRRISHVMLLASPNGGIPEEQAEQIWNRKYKDLAANQPFISTMRAKWAARFPKRYPFRLHVVAGTQDHAISLESNFGPFEDKECVTIAGDHLSLLKGEDRENDAYQLIFQSLNNKKFFHRYTSQEEIEVTLGEYRKVVERLLPRADDLDVRSMKQLVFALEGLGRVEEIMDLLREHPLAQRNTHLLGLIAGRLKRKYLETLSFATAQESFTFYEKGLELAQKREDWSEAYYHSINLAFLSLLAFEDPVEMKRHAREALDFIERAGEEGLWVEATKAEAYLYLKEEDKARKHYQAAALLGGLREKISIHTNAYQAFIGLSGNADDQQPFLQFLHQQFLR